MNSTGLPSMCPRRSKMICTTWDRRSWKLPCSRRSASAACSRDQGKRHAIRVDAYQPHLLHCVNTPHRLGLLCAGCQAAHRRGRHRCSCKRDTAPAAACSGDDLDGARLGSLHTANHGSMGSRLTQCSRYPHNLPMVLHMVQYCEIVLWDAPGSLLHREASGVIMPKSSTFDALDGEV